MPRQPRTFACWLPVGRTVLLHMVLLCSILIVIIKGVVPATQQLVSYSSKLEQRSSDSCAAVGRDLTRVSNIGLDPQPVRNNTMGAIRSRCVPEPHPNARSTTSGAVCLSTVCEVRVARILPAVLVAAMPLFWRTANASMHSCGLTCRWQRLLLPLCCSHSPLGYQTAPNLAPAHLPVAAPDAACVLLAKSPFRASRLSSSWKMSSPSLSPAGMLKRACGLPQAHLLTFSTCTGDTTQLEWRSLLS